MVWLLVHEWGKGGRSLKVQSLEMFQVLPSFYLNHHLSFERSLSLPLLPPLGPIAWALPSLASLED